MRTIAAMSEPIEIVVMVSQSWRNQLLRSQPRRFASAPITITISAHTRIRRHSGCGTLDGAAPPFSAIDSLATSLLTFSHRPLGDGVERGADGPGLEHLDGDAVAHKRGRRRVWFRCQAWHEHLTRIGGARSPTVLALDDISPQRDGTDDKREARRELRVAVAPESAYAVR